MSATGPTRTPSKLGILDLKTPQGIEAALEQRHREIEAVLEQYHRDVAELRQRLNAFSLINQRLPPELLAEIFVHYIAETSPSGLETYAPDARPPDYKKPYEWVQITHICHFWRDVALLSPRLWNRILVTQHTNVDCVREMLARSQQAPLFVSVDEEHHTNSDSVDFSLQAILAELHRIRSLELSVSSATLFKHSVHIERPAPLLRRFLLIDIDAQDEVVSRAPLPIATVHLERVILSGYELTHIRHTLLPSIKHLTLLLPPQGFSLELLHSALGDMTLIETLTLSLWDGPSTHAVLGVVAFPYLERLQLIGASVVCAAFLRHTTFPATSTTVIEGLDGADFNSFVSAMADKLNGDGVLGKPAPIKSLALTHPDGNSSAWTLQGWTMERPIESLPKDRAPFQFSVTFNESCSVPHLVELFSSLPSSEVTSVYMGGPAMYLMISDWFNSFKHMERLMFLKISSMSVDGLPPALMMQQDGQVISQRATTSRKVNTLCKPMFPRLRLLVLHEVFFRELVGHDEEILFFELLRKALKRRMTRRLPLRQLIITSAINFTASDASKLKSVVKALEWDGVETMIDDEDSYDDESDLSMY
ncbi:hypothetical protein PHLCEN_2v11924 [Hermanssonia centrifuga]|uniref:Uncharacterized protein n=1 Tax=Hermanssonia centrifuga TaxID=98765 RepID=A0A2R6NIK2_9APHY|nr:hypothetical protein PHLCEN_2v11924 [Hermanssonia centrifuga]